MENKGKQREDCKGSSFLRLFLWAMGNRFFECRKWKGELGFLMAFRLAAGPLSEMEKGKMDGKGGWKNGAQWGKEKGCQAKKEYTV